MVKLVWEFLLTVNNWWRINTMVALFLFISSVFNLFLEWVGGLEITCTEYVPLLAAHRSSFWIQFCNLFFHLISQPSGSILVKLNCGCKMAWVERKKNPSSVSSTGSNRISQGWNTLGMFYATQSPTKQHVWLFLNVVNRMGPSVWLPF